MQLQATAATACHMRRVQRLQRVWSAWHETLQCQYKWRTLCIKENKRNFLYNLLGERLANTLLVFNHTYCCSLARAHLVSRSHLQLQLLPQTGVALAKVIACCNETARQPVGSIKETERGERGGHRRETRLISTLHPLARTKPRFQCQWQARSSCSALYLPACLPASSWFALSTVSCPAPSLAQL